LGAVVSEDETGKVVRVNFQGACTRSTLALLAKFPDLKELNFSFSAVGGADLASLKDLPNLEVLTFHSTFVKDSGLEAISSLKEIYLTDTKVTDAGVKQLQAALPAATIRPNK